MNPSCLLLLFVVIYRCCAEANGVDLVVNTKYGPVRGAISSTGLHKVWSTIPYAAPPTGSNRWKPPQQLTPWTQIKDANVRTPICPQETGLPLEMKEDCLYLSVYVPANDSPTALPVQVWIHGGSFLTGGAAMYNGEIMSGTDIVFVAINYRLGALGNLAHSVLNTPDRASGIGFYGMQDQRAALQWVQDNIGYFGGDSSKVTISGESAGAISVCAHLVSPKSAPFFHQAIAESGLCELGTKEEGIATGNAIAKTLGCTGSDSEILACLLEANTSSLLRATTITYYPPSLSSPDELLDQPYALLASGKGVRVPLLVGTNVDEYSLWVCSDPKLKNITEEEYHALIVASYPTIAEEIFQTYPLSQYPTPGAALIDVTSDHTFKCPTKALAEVYSQSTKSPTFMYSLNYTPDFLKKKLVTEPLFGVTDPLCLGVAHSFELAFLFNEYELISGQHLLPPFETNLRAIMRNAWASFVSSGTPVLPDVKWPTYNTNDESYLIFDLKLSVGMKFRDPYCKLWVK